MGMFDTYRGEVKCPQCGRMIYFEEQTKEFQCLLEYFEVGDYLYGEYTNKLDMWNISDVNCHCCNKKDIKVNILIKDNQVIGYYNEDQAKLIKFCEVENIPEHHAKKSRQLLLNTKYHIGIVDDHEKFSGLDTLDINDEFEMFETKWKVIDKHMTINNEFTLLFRDNGYLFTLENTNNTIEKIIVYYNIDSKVATAHRYVEFGYNYMGGKDIFEMELNHFTKLSLNGKTNVVRIYGESEHPKES